MNGVVEQVDLRAFPMEIAKHMLQLGNCLNMGKGPAAYNEAEFMLKVWLMALIDYRKLYFDNPKTLPINSTVRFIQLHTNSCKEPSLLAVQLLDFMHYFPEDISEYDYHKVLSEDELN